MGTGHVGWGGEGMRRAGMWKGEDGQQAGKKKRKEQTGLERCKERPPEEAAAEKRDLGPVGDGGEQHPSSPTGPVREVGRGRGSSRRER